MYLNTGTMIGIIIALVACISTICYNIYIIKKQDDMIRHMSKANATLRKINMGV